MGNRPDHMTYFYHFAQECLGIIYAPFLYVSQPLDRVGRKKRCILLPETQHSCSKIRHNIHIIVHHRKMV